MIGALGTIFMTRTIGTIGTTRTLGAVGMARTIGAMLRADRSSRRMSRGSRA